MGEAVGPKAVGVSVELGSGTARLRVGARAGGIREALGLVGARYPHGEGAVVFPMEPEGFFASDPPAPAGMVATEQVRDEAA